MKELTIVNGKEVKVIDSREVAEMLGVEHKEVIRKIQGGSKEVGLIPTLESGNFPPTNYFIESSYLDKQNKTRKCYLVTKMGCELLGNKQQGEKGILFTAKYVERFNKMEEGIKTLQPSVVNELAEMREEYNFLFEEVKGSYEELSEKVDKIMNIQLNTMINIEKLANSFCMIAQANTPNPIAPVEVTAPKKEEDSFTISDIAAELGLAKTKENAAMLNKILAKETVIVCEGKNKFPSPILPKDWYIKAKFTDKTTKEITHYVIWTAKGKEEIIKILKKHLPEQTKMKI